MVCVKYALLKWYASFHPFHLSALANDPVTMQNIQTLFVRAAQRYRTPFALPLLVTHIYMHIIKFIPFFQTPTFNEHTHRSAFYRCTFVHFGGSIDFFSCTSSSFRFLSYNFLRRNEWKIKYSDHMCAVYVLHSMQARSLQFSNGRIPKNICSYACMHAYNSTTMGMQSIKLCNIWLLPLKEIDNNMKGIRNTPFQQLQLIPLHCVFLWIGQAWKVKWDNCLEWKYIRATCFRFSFDMRLVVYSPHYAGKSALQYIDM